MSSGISLNTQCGLTLPPNGRLEGSWECDLEGRDMLEVQTVTEPRDEDEVSGVRRGMIRN
jgi:hypothetical protein